MTDGSQRHAFRAMGTDVTLISGGDADPRTFRRAARDVELVFAREEQRFSRFRPDSELSRVNERAGRRTQVTSGFFALLGFALEAAGSTRGLFDPTALPALVAAGYDRDFDQVLAGARAALHPPEPCGRWSEVELDGDLLRLPPGVALDFGGVAKGWTVDLAAQAAISGAGLPWAVVNVGGDLRLAGCGPRTRIEVGLDDPEAPGLEAARIRLEAGAVASSSVTRRSWGTGLHHLIDPRTARPADTGVTPGHGVGRDLRRGRDPVEVGAPGRPPGPRSHPCRPRDGRRTHRDEPPVSRGGRG